MADVVAARLGRARPRRTRGTVLPIAIRPDVTVRVHHLPYDLTPAEAARLAAVIVALANLETDEAERRRQKAYEEANQRHPLPISGG